MPLIIPVETEEAIELAELVDMLESQPFDGADLAGFASWGAQLRKLANNRAFLADLVLAELKDRCGRQLRHNQYSAQVILLHGRSDTFVLRANFWPGQQDDVVRQSGTDPFFYGVPHDHNFSFLTVGYFGPGYWSDYYEYDYDQVAGYVGEKVDLRFIERSRLEQGKVMLYRAHRDVHLQLPADSMSISINIIETAYSQQYKDQYLFDVERGEVTGILNRMPLEPMLRLVAQMGGGNGKDLLTAFANGHASERVRFAALKAQASAAATIDDRLDLFEAAAGDASRYVSQMARREARRFEKGRPWIEGAAPGN